MSPVKSTEEDPMIVINEITNKLKQKTYGVEDTVSQYSETVDT